MRACLLVCLLVVQTTTTTTTTLQIQYTVGVCERLLARTLQHSNDRVVIQVFVCCVRVCVHVYVYVNAAINVFIQNRDYVMPLQGSLL